MKLNSRDLKTIVHRTLEHYDQRAEEFWAGTRDHDVSQNIAAMLHRERDKSATSADFKFPSPCDRRQSWVFWVKVPHRPK